MNGVYGDCIAWRRNRSERRDGQHAVKESSWSSSLRLEISESLLLRADYAIQ